MQQSPMPSAPELPPMKPVQPAPMPAAAPQSVPPQGAPSRPVNTGGTRRLRQMVSAIAGGGFFLVSGIVALELVARDEFRPTTIMATIEARTDLGTMNQKMKMKPGEFVMNEADYQRALAKAQRQGQAEAELDFQKKVAVVQADKERVVAAYQTLYQRANMIAQAGLQMESLAQQFRARLLEMSNGGRNMVIMFKDIFCGLGDPNACASARQDRGTMIAEADELSRGDVGNRIRELMAGIEDPATFVTREDRRENGVPSLDR